MSRCHGHDPADTGEVVYCDPDGWCNRDRNPVTQKVRGEVTNPAPHHTTPHHTTKTPFARERAQAPSTNATEANARIHAIHPLDALAAVACLIRPDWSPLLVRAVVARTKGGWGEIAERVLRAATDPGVHHPAAIENADTRRYAATPIPPTLAERRAELARLTEEQA